jgi:hypothetical protein
VFGRVDTMVMCMVTCSYLGDVCGGGGAQRLRSNGLGGHENAWFTVSTAVQLENKQSQVEHHFPAEHELYRRWWSIERVVIPVQPRK